MNDCMADPSGFTRGFLKKTRDRHIPVSGSIELTRRCNLKCIHCYLPRNASGAEMDTKSVVAIIDDISAEGCLFLMLTGGEPLVRADFPELYTHARGSGMMVTVFTNGTLVSDDTVRLFKEMPPYGVEITLYGASRETYKAVTGSADAYDKCMQGIRKLREAGVRFKLKSVLLSLNSHDLKAMEDIARGLDVGYRIDHAIFPRLDRDPAPLSYRLRPEDAVTLELSSKDRSEELRDFYQRAAPVLNDRSLYICGAGRTSFHIDAYGMLKPCLMLETMGRPIASGGFVHAWGGMLDQVQARELKEDHDCAGCSHRHICNYCPGFSYLEGGSEDHVSQYLCATGRERVQALGLS